MIRDDDTRSPLPLDPIDREIFRELQRDGRAPFVAIADRLGVSEAHVRRRTTRLMDAHVFSITAVADPKSLGVDCMAWLSIRAHQSRATAVAEALVELPRIDYVVQTSGAFNVMAEASCRSSTDLYRLLTEIRAIPGVQRTETSPYLDILCQRFQWSVDGSAQAVHERGPTPLDPLDIDIVDQLQRDGRASFRQIAQSLSVSERSVSTRFQRLVSDGALQVIAVGDPATLGFEAMTWLAMRLREGAGYDDAAAALSAVSGIDYIVIATGRYDMMAELVCPDRAALLGTLEHEVGAIDAIAEVHSFMYLRLLYRSAVGAWGASRSLAIPLDGRNAPHRLQDAADGGR